MEYKIVNALSRDVEREQLNKILRHISATLSSVNSGGLTESQVRAWIAESVPVVPSIKPTTVTLTGDATGAGTGTTSISIPVELTGKYIEDVPFDSMPYWRQDGTWQNVPFPLLSLAYLSPSGFSSYNEEELEWNSRVLTGTSGNITVTNGDGVLGDPVIDLAPVTDSGAGTLLAITRDGFGRVTGTKAATITGTAGQINVANGNAASGLPTISLPDVADTGTGTLQKTQFDSKGRKTGTASATTTDLPEGTNLYFTNARADARIEMQKGVADGLATLGPDSKLPANQLPALAITETFVVNSQAAMLALTAQEGDVAVRTDLSKSFILTASPASTLSNWQELLTPTGTSGTVSSVGLSAPVGFTVSGSPVTSSGTLTFSYSAGYQGYTSTEASKLAGIQAGAQVNVPTNLAQGTRTSTTVPITSSTGTSAALSVASTTLAGVMSAADKTKLDGIAANATANSGTVTSVALSVPTGLVVAGSPITASGTFTVTYASGYQGYTTAESTKLAGIAAGATAGATWGTNLSGIPANITSWATINPANIPTQTGGDLLVSKSSAIVGVGVSGGRNGGLANFGNNGVGDIGIFSEHASGRVRIRPDGSLSNVGEFSVNTAGFSWGGFAGWHAGNHGNTGDPHTQYFLKPSGTARQFVRGDGTLGSSLVSADDLFNVSGYTVDGFTSGRATVGASGNGRMILENSQTADTLIDIDPKPMDGISSSQFRFFRNVNTTGFTRFTLYLGDGTAASNAALAGKGSNSWVCSNNGNFGVGTASPTAAKLVVSGNTAPAVDNSYSLGTGSLRYSEVFSASGTINTSDAREKTPVRALTDSELEAAIVLGKEIGAYRWLAMVAEKGESAREHVGMTVQRCIEIMELHGLDAFKYGFVCYDEWDELEEILGEDGEVAQEARPAGDRYSFRMDELAMFILAGQNHRLEMLEERLNQM